MSDLTEKESSIAIKISGADSAGIETNYVSADGNGNLHAADVLRVGGTQGTISVSTTAIEAKVGASRLNPRKSLTAYNNGSQTVYWGFTSGVTTSTGTPILKTNSAVWSIGDQTIYLIAPSGSNDVRITECG